MIISLPDCNGHPDVYTGNADVKKLFMRNDEELDRENYWIGDSFILDLNLERSIHTILLVNTHDADHRNRATAEFKVYISNDVTAYWEEVLHETLPNTLNMKDPLPLMNFTITPIKGRYVYFKVLSFYGQGGGLQYFAAVSGRGLHNVCYCIFLFFDRYFEL